MIYLTQIKFDPTISPYQIIAILGMAAAAVGAWAFLNYKVRDLNELKPNIEKIPLLEATIGQIANDMSEIKGTLSVVPSLMTTSLHHDKDIDELKRRIERLETARIST